jgi:hypothetical protein
MNTSIKQIPTTYKDSLKPALLAIGLMAVVGASLVQTTANAGERPLSDFLSRQGTYCLHLDGSGNPNCTTSGYGGSGCFIQAPPSPNFVDWTDPFNNSSVSFDYAGLANTALGGTLGTSVDGMINEVVRTDGSVITTVLLHTKNALTWAHTNIGVTLPGTSPLLFGQRPAAVASGAPPSLGSCTLKVVLQGTAQNQPLPDLLELVFCSSPTWSLVSISFSGQADGTLPNGTPGRLQVTEVGLIALFVKQAFVLGVPSRVALDAFPAEHINITAK